MQEDAFEAYMAARNLADRTRQQRAYALQRIEARQNVDLDVEFERDGMRDRLSRFAYSSVDALQGAPNPSAFDIDADKLRSHLAWYKSNLTDYLRFKGGGVGIEADGLGPEDVSDAETRELIEETVGRTFALERDLQAALRQNLGQLESGLRVEDGGREKKIEAGFIDILARDAKGQLTIIELKTETSRPEVVAQTFAYMGCVAEESGEAVRGIIVASDHHPRVIHASKAVPNLKLQSYRYKIVFE